jgi:hypothetical protein
MLEGGMHKGWRFWVWLFGHRIVWLLLCLYISVPLGRDLAQDVGFAILASPVQAKVLDVGVDREVEVLAGGPRPDTVENRLVPWADVAVEPLGRSCQIRGQRAFWSERSAAGKAEMLERLKAMLGTRVEVLVREVDGQLRCQQTRWFSIELVLFWLVTASLVVGFLIATVLDVYKQYRKAVP